MIENCDECVYEYVPFDIEPCTSCIHQKIYNDPFLTSYNNFVNIDIFYDKDIVVKEYDYVGTGHCNWYIGKIEPHINIFLKDIKVGKLSDVKDIDKYMSLREFMRLNNLLLYTDTYILMNFFVDKMFIKGE